MSHTTRKNYILTKIRIIGRFYKSNKHFQRNNTFSNLYDTY